MTSIAKRPSAYQDRLAAFAAQAGVYTEAHVEHPGKDWTECAPGEESHWTGSSVRIGNGRAACECCGTRRLKTIYPVVPDGDISRVKWIGVECLKNLRDMGKANAKTRFVVEV